MAPHLPDRTIARARRGDRTAQREVVEAWWPQLCRWARLECPDPHTAEDGLQDALVRLLRAFGSFDPARPLGPWLHGVVRNACRDARSRSSRHAGREGPLQQEPSATPVDLARRVDLSRGAQQALAALDALPPRRRAVIELVDWQGLTPAEAARELQITPSAARAHLTYARRAMRAHLLTEAPHLRAVVRNS